MPLFNHSKTRLASFLLAQLIGLPMLAQAQAQTQVQTQDIAVVPEPEKTIPEEKWNAKFQATYIGQSKPSFNAPYSGTNSLITAREHAYSSTITAYLGYRPWAGGELYFNPEMIQSVAMSTLHGLGGLTNAEQQKTSGPKPKFYKARLFLKQTYGFGGEQEAVESGPNQLAGMVDRQRLVLTVGNLGLIDVFDNNAYAHDPRTQFVNWTFLTHGAFDYAADARGYSNGAAVEYYQDAWAVRAARFMVPRQSNGLPLDLNIGKHYGDQVELEHGHMIAEQPGKLKLLAFRNQAVMGSYADAVTFANANGGVPDVGNVRKESVKYGLGLSLEQRLRSDVGLFARASWADGRTETYSFTEIENSVSAGVVVNGNRWGRPNDTFGLAVAQNGLNKDHRNYLALGGLGAFIGDGKINYRPERIIEGYYNVKVFKTSSIMVGLQRITNPAYNADRGPVSVATLRLRTEF